MYLSGYYFNMPIDESHFFYTYIESVIYELRYCKENIVHRYVPLPTYIYIYLFVFQNFSPTRNKVIFYVFISFVSYLSSCTRIREVYNISDYGQSFPAKDPITVAIQGLCGFQFRFWGPRILLCLTGFIVKTAL